MVKGVSKQVIVVPSPDPKLFEQAIFILREDALGAEGVTDDALMREATRLIRAGASGKKRNKMLPGPVWAAGGALVTGAVWILTMVF